MAKHGASLHKAAIKPGKKVKIQIETKNRPIADGLREIAEKLNVMAPGLQVLEQGKGANPSSHQGIQQAFLRKRAITKKGKFTLWYDITEKA